MDGAAGAAASAAADAAQDAPPSANNGNTSSSKPKVSLSLGKKKKKKTGTSSSFNTNEHFATSTSALAQESEDANKTIADRAEEVAQNRKEELIIPCVGGGSGGGRTRPLLAGRARALKTENEDGEAPGASADVGNNDADDAPVKSEHVIIKSDPDANVDGNIDDDAAAAEALIRSATERTQNRSAGGAVGDTNFDARGDLVIKKEENTNELMAQAMRGTKAGGASRQNRDDETQEFHRDLARQADDLDVESEAYANVPISEFGAAMLRGMGWSGGDTNDTTKGQKKYGKNDEDDDAGMMKPRHHRLGLGAAPRPVSLSSKDGGITKPGGRHRALRPHELERAERERKDEEEFHRRAAERARLDKQRTVQVGSVVRVRDIGGGGGGGGGGGASRKRAIMVKTSGVPGLNQVLIRYEGSAEDVSVRKSNVILVEQVELDDNPFVEAPASSSFKPESKASREKSEEEKKESGSGADRSGNGRRGDNDGHRRNSVDRYSDRDRKRDRHDDRDRRDRYRDDDNRRDKKKSRSSREYDDRRRSSRDEDRDRDRSRRHDRDDDHYESSRDRKRSKKEMSDRNDRDNRSTDDRRSSGKSNTIAATESLRWLTPNIRVRVITKKLAKGRQYKEKGVVMDVLPGGAHATIQMADGEVLDKVPERYLETALPKVGGNAIVLAGDAQHRYAKGRLLERDSSKGRAAVQLFEEMNILNLSLDDIAEWCGPLDSDMMD